MKTSINFFTLLGSLVIILFLFACEKDNFFSSQAGIDLGGENRGNDNKVTICHKNGQGEYQALTVSQNAVSAHLAHGDYLSDADGDGYTAIGACTGSMDDCDDGDASVHPGAAENCQNGKDDNCNGLTDCDDPVCEESCASCPCFTRVVLNAEAPFEFYFDTEEINCVNLPEYVEISRSGLLVYTMDLGTDKQVYGDVLVSCNNLSVNAGEITLAEWESCRNILRQVIADNPETLEGCTGTFDTKGGASALQGNDKVPSLEQLLFNR